MMARELFWNKDLQIDKEKVKISPTDNEQKAVSLMLSENLIKPCRGHNIEGKSLKFCRE
jgi:hypothetical protein